MNSSILPTLFLLFTLALTTSGADTEKTNASPPKGSSIACSDIPKGGYEFEVPGVGKCLLMNVVSSKTKEKGNCHVDLESLKAGVKAGVKGHPQVHKRIIKVTLKVDVLLDGTITCMGKGSGCEATIIVQKR